MNIRSIKFSQDHNVEFYKELKKRVNTYFKSNQISKFGNTNMVVKTIFMVSLYVVPYILILTIAEQPLFALLLWAIAGFGMAGIGLSVMHDANHGSYSKYGFINKSLGYLANMVGGSDLNWRIQHNVLHHTYTNVDGMDEDIDVNGLMRFSPNQKRLKAHRYQHVYAWFLYGLLTINWFFRKDYQQINRYKKMGLLATQNISYGKALFIIVFTKLLYAFLMIALPIWVAPSAWYVSLIGFFLMQFIAGFLLSIIFQSAHVVPSSNFPTPNESGDINADWAVNQLYNTANFAPKARILSWYVGGLNFQVEHHLFPNICHVHYLEILPIFREVAQKYGLNYMEMPYRKSLASHFRFLKGMGKHQTFKSIPFAR